MKRHTGFRNNGETGHIYRLADVSAAGNPTITVYVDLDNLGFDTGTDPHPADAAPTSDWDIDANSWDPVGKISLGDLDISDDDSTLWTINLFDKKLYRIPVQSTSPTAGQISSYDTPSPSTCATIDERPFAVAFYDGLVYVGITCTAESTFDAGFSGGEFQTSDLPLGNSDPSELEAYVYSFDPGTTTWTQELNFALDYPRACAVLNGGTCDPAEWQPWVDVFTIVDTSFTNATANEKYYPQPLLADIEFDNGNMILGIRDRFADQMGYQQRSTDSSDTSLYSGDGVGDILRACGDPASGWTLESNARCGGLGTGPQNSGEGPGDGEYFYQDDYPNHDEISVAGLVQVPGLLDVVNTGMDPIYDPDEFNQGGIFWFDNDEGDRSRSYLVYDSGFVPDPPNGTFAKAGGLGDLEAFCEPAPPRDRQPGLGRQRRRRHPGS